MENKENTVKKVDISIIMPVYNVDKYIATAIKSVIQQTFNNWELICIDDGSTDESLSLIKYYASNDDRIEIITQSNLGPAKARNIGLDKARGEYILFLDSDDFLEIDACERLLALAKQKNTDSIIFGGRTFNSDNAPEWIIKKLNPSQKSYEKFNADFIFKEESARPFIWLHFIKASLLNTQPKVRFDEDMKLGEDQIFLFEYMIRIKRLEIINNKFYNYRINRDCSIMSIYANLPYTKFNIHLSLCEKIILLYKKKNVISLYGTQLLEWIAEFLYWDFNSFREDLKCIYSNRIKNIIDSVGLSIRTMEEYLREYTLTMLGYCDKNIEFKDIERDLENKLEFAKNILYKTSNSKKFFIGKLLTRKNKRLSKEFYLEVKQQINKLL